MCAVSRRHLGFENLLHVITPTDQLVAVLETMQTSNYGNETYTYFKVKESIKKLYFGLHSVVIDNSSAASKFQKLKNVCSGFVLHSSGG